MYPTRGSRFEKDVDSLKLKAIEICGFKSFADKTRIDFNKPVTCVVGPNGSGKSNISDAILWVTGEQSSKALRGGKMEDVIFGGTEKRRQMGYAEVSLILDNEDGRLAVETSEVMITRRYFRSGESEYYINRTQCRLRDINELLMDTGMGREGYSIIGQGKIDEILSARSTDRRGIFEEAAGISKFRHRKEESEHKLQRTEENLVRVNDKIAELELQVEPLRKQAETAKKYLLLRDELRELELGLWTDSLKKLASGRESYEALKKESGYQLDQAKADMEEFYAETEQYSQRMQEKDVLADQLRSRLTQNEENTAAEESAAAVLRANMESSAAEQARIEMEMNEQEDRAEALLAQIEDKKKHLTEIESKQFQLTADADKLTQSLSELYESAESAEQETADIMAEEQRLVGQIQEEQKEISALAAAAQEMEDRSSAAERDAIAAGEQLLQIHQNADECSRKLEECRTHLESVDNVAAGYRMRTENRRRKAEAAEQKKQELILDSKTLHSRISLLTEMEKEYAGYSRAVKSVMQEAERGLLKGICGTVGELLKTKDVYATAVETALGGGMQDIIVENEESGKAGISFLKRRDAGRATFLPCNTMRGSILKVNGLGNEDGYVGTAVDLVSYDKKFSDIYTYLLGKTAVVEDMDSAIRISRKYSRMFKIVTLDGQVINSNGSMTGGSAIKNAGILSRANELENLKVRLQTVTDALREAENQLAAAAAEYKDAEHNMLSAQQERQKLAEELAGLQSDNTHWKLMIEAAETASSSSKEDSRELQERLKSNAESIEIHRSAINNTEIRLAQVRQKLESAVQGKNQLKEKREQFGESMQNIREHRASLAAEKQSLENSVSELEKLKDGLSGGRSRQNEYLEGLKTKADEMNTMLSERTEKLHSLRLVSEQLRSEIETVTQEKMALEGERSRHTKQMQIKNEAVLRLEREVSELEQKLIASELEEKQLVDKLWDTYELSRSDAMASAKIPENLGEARHRAAELKRSMSKLGTPNIGAIDEFERVNERYTYLTDQRDDIEKAREELNGIIGSITDEMKDIFRQEFQTINEQFKQTFLELFGGGKANLELEEESDILNCGIEIKVQPPGKSLKTITLLSGGEKAFVAIALYFAILKVRPAPFVVMDEIEAALDEANVSRFAGYMRQMSGKTQMVVISHRRGTMEEADVLYGVTMQEQGISRVLTIDLDEAERSILKE